MSHTILGSPNSSNNCWRLGVSWGNDLSWQWHLMLAVTFSWCWLFLLAVDELWTFSQLEHSNILIRETNPTKHLQWFLLIPSASFVQPGRSDWPSPLTASGHLSFGLAWSQGKEEHENKQQPGQKHPTGAHWHLAGVSSGLRIAEKATIWLCVLV